MAQTSQTLGYTGGNSPLPGRKGGLLSSQRGENSLPTTLNLSVKTALSATRPVCATGPAVCTAPTSRRAGRRTTYKTGWEGGCTRVVYTPVGEVPPTKGGWEAYTGVNLRVYLRWCITGLTSGYTSGGV